MRSKRGFLWGAMAAGMLAAAPSHAAYILEIDTDGADDGAIAFNPGFSFGGDTTTASQSASAAAFGTTGGDSIFGGDGAAFADTYVYSYSPGAQADNLAIAAGADLGGGNLASGLVGGGVGTYRVYATWPYTENVSGGLVQYTLSTAGAADVVVAVDQNFAGDEWVLLGDIFYSDLLSSIDVTQEAGVNTFVSMRAHGLLFEQVNGRITVPEPVSLALMALGLAGMGVQRRRGQRAAP